MAESQESPPLGQSHWLMCVSVCSNRKLVQYSQKMPQASFQEMGGMVDKIVATVAPCCSGDMVTCMKERVNYVFSLFLSFIGVFLF